MRDRSLAALVKTILSNLRVIKIIFFILIILTATNVILNLLVVPLLPLLIVLSVGLNGVHHLNIVVPMTGITSICILMSAWIGLGAYYVYCAHPHHHLGRNYKN